MRRWKEEEEAVTANEGMTRGGERCSCSGMQRERGDSATRVDGERRGGSPSPVVSRSLARLLARSLARSPRLLVGSPPRAFAHLCRFRCCCLRSTLPPPSPSLPPPPLPSPPPPRPGQTQTRSGVGTAGSRDSRAPAAPAARTPPSAPSIIPFRSPVPYMHATAPPPATILGRTSRTSTN